MTAKQAVVQLGLMGKLDVESYAGYRGVERPLRFRIRGRQFEVMEIEDRWYSPRAMYFRVRANDDNFYVLRYDEDQDAWTLDAFRAAKRGAA